MRSTASDHLSKIAHFNLLFLSSKFSRPMTRLRCVKTWLLRWLGMMMTAQLILAAARAGSRNSQRRIRRRASAS